MHPTTSTPPVVAIVLNWNNLPDTLECIASVRSSDYPHLSVWVVDNASDEDPTSTLRAKYPDVRIIRNSRNLGYAGGNNAGIRAAIMDGAVYVLLLNNDLVVASDCIARLVACATADRHIGMATPKVFHYHRPNDVYWDGGVIDWQSGDARHDSRRLSEAAGVVRSEWLNGCCLLVRVDTIHDIGFLDEHYFLYFEDAAWTVSAARRGWSNAVVPRALAWHKVHASTGGFANPLTRYYFFRNRYLFATKFSPLPNRLRWKIKYLSGIWSEYVRERHQLVNRQVFLSVLTSIVLGSSGAYGRTFATRTLVPFLDATLSSLLSAASTIKRLLLFKRLRSYRNDRRPG